MRENGYALGGEQSGHIIIGSYLPTGDGLLAGAVLARAVAESGTPLSVLTACETYPQVNADIRTRDKAALLADPALAVKSGGRDALPRRAGDAESQRHRRQDKDHGREPRPFPRRFRRTHDRAVYQTEYDGLTPYSATTARKGRGEAPPPCGRTAMQKKARRAARFLFFSFPLFRDILLLEKGSLSPLRIRASAPSGSPSSCPRNASRPSRHWRGHNRTCRRCRSACLRIRRRTPLSG